MQVLETHGRLVWPVVIRPTMEFLLVWKNSEVVYYAMVGTRLNTRSHAVECHGRCIGI